MDILLKEFVITLLSEIFSIFNDKQKLRTCEIIFKHINKYINLLIKNIYLL